ncbi:hypothetical protein [Parapedobacter sp. 10938]|uniref:hypothetical protein n=1 Tax=Parapedobacter flavus TaxID=3110225 RepID=UPI002DBB65B5|nr:hypothetical protein [Parapedobacter sp. 10938]MEC3881178.1 hypothetical protein [Parapedobacter sp. 10938]
MSNTGLSNRHKHILLITGLLLILLGFGLGRFSSNETKSNNEQQNVPHSAPVNDNRTFFWDIYPELVIPNAGQEINGNLTLLDSNNTIISLADISADFPILVFRYSKFDCHLCVDQILDKLTRLFKVEEKKVCILVDGYSSRELRIKYKGSAWKFPIYILDKEKLGLKLENKNLPFLFVLKNKNLEVSKIFVPFKEHSRQTDTYLQNIATYFD